MTQVIVNVKRFIDIYVGLPKSLNDFGILWKSSTILYQNMAFMIVSLCD
jgi:hypothetical protein